MFLSANSTRVREQPWLLLSVFSAQYRWPIMALSTLFPCLYHLLVQESQEQPVLIIFVLLASSRVPGILQARKNQKQKFNCMISKIMRLSWKKNWHQLLSPPHLHAFLFTLSEYFFFFFFWNVANHTVALQFHSEVTPITSIHIPLAKQVTKVWKANSKHSVNSSMLPLFLNTLYQQTQRAVMLFVALLHIRHYTRISLFIVCFLPLKSKLCRGRVCLVLFIAILEALNRHTNDL